MFVLKRPGFAAMTWPDPLGFVMLVLPPRIGCLLGSRYSAVGPCLSDPVLSSFWETLETLDIVLFLIFDIDACWVDCN